MTVGVITNADKDDGYKYTQKMCAFLTRHGAVPLLLHETAQKAELPDNGVSEEKFFSESAFLAVLGGDGTMLRAARYAAPYGTPMLGINLGNLGYLTDVDKHEGLIALAQILNGEAKREKRIMLTLSGAKADLKAEDLLALNDICLSRSGFRMMMFALYINGQYMDTVRADGLLVATPTGSTAYNLSAGGPVLSPDGEMAVVTALCPHALHTRPLVISAHDTVEIRVQGEGSAAVSTDGEPRFTLSHGERVTIKRSAYSAVILKTSSVSFYEILRRKMNGGNYIQKDRAYEIQTSSEDL